MQKRKSYETSQQQSGDASNVVKKPAKLAVRRRQKEATDDKDTPGVLSGDKRSTNVTYNNGKIEVQDLDQRNGQITRCAKIKMLLFPLTDSMRLGLEEDGYNPFLELTLSRKKKISSVIKHLKTKWGCSRVATGEIMVFPFNTLPENVHLSLRWTRDSINITAGDVHLAVKPFAIHHMLLFEGERAYTKFLQVKSYMQQLLSGLQHCHEKGILHRDIKGSNLLIDKTGMLKIADFGLANYYRPKSRRPLTSRVVTLWYRAPELLLGSTDYGVGIDLWSAGCLLAEMFIARPILPGRNEVEQLHKIFKLCGSPPEDYWKLLKSPASFRPPHYKSSFKEVFHRMPDSTFGLLNQLLHLDPARRGTASSALQDEFFGTSPLACDLSGLPMIKSEDDELVIAQKRRRVSKAKKRSGRKHIRKLSDLAAENIQRDHEDLSQRSNATSHSTSSTSSSMKNSKTLQNSPPSPIPAEFRSQLNRSAVTEAHPNALKNIKNYPLLMASIREAASHLEDHRLNSNRKSLSAVDLRNLDDVNVSKLLGLKEH